MRRIRWLFLLLGAVVLLPLVVLVHRALEGAARERELSHRAVAERLFDEMERELSALLQAEEERPFADYRAGSFEDAVRPNRVVGGAGTAGGDGVVLGHFQVDPEGKVDAPVDALAPEVRDALSGRRAQKSAAAERFEAVVESALRAGDGDAAGPARAEGSDVAQRDALAPLADAEPTPAEPDRKQVSPYQALQSFNKAGKERSDRQVVREARVEAQTRLAESAAAPADPRATERDVVAEAAAPPAVTLSEEAELADAPVLARNEPESSFDEGRPRAAAPVRREIFATTETADANVEVHPMSGRLVGESRLVLDRQVFVNGARYLQGLVVDVPALFAHLDRAVVGGSELAAYVDRSFFTAGSAPAATSQVEGFRYRHRFAEPFDALAVQLDLAPLPDEGGGIYLTAIAVLLLVTGTGGLVALYRMVSVTLRFAERRNNFVAAVSHELKTPLTAIRMHAEMLRDGMVDDPEKRGSYYRTITAESERLTRLINNVLEFSRLEQGTREASLVVGDLGPVVREAAAILEPHARELGFRVEIDIEPDLPAVRFERDAVLQVVFNLVDNALKYAREAGDRLISIRCTREGEGVCVAVSDRGPGVPPQHLSKIFEPFYRCQDELTRTAKGTGIGLALVRGLAETMGAAVSGRNLREGGFEVRLRFRPAHG